MSRIAQLPLFRELSATGQTLLGQGFKSHWCSENELVLRKGETIDGAYVVLSGRLRVFSIAPNGNQTSLYFVDAGETCVLALNCLFNDLLYPAWVEAECDTAVAVIPNRTYRRLFESEAPIQDLTIRALSTAMFRLIEILEQVQGLTLEQRLASLILSRASSKGKLCMTQQQMAQHLGTSREVVARIVAKLSNLGWIRSSRGQIVIQEAESLAKLGFQEAKRSRQNHPADLAALSFAKVKASE